MAVQALGYVGLTARSLEDWAAFGTRFLGMQLTERNRSSLAFRMDDRRQRLVVAEDAEEGLGFCGWEVADAAALDAMAARLEAAGVSVEHGPRALADERRVAGLIRTRDPLGTASSWCTAQRRPTRPSCRAARSPASAPGRSAWGMRC